MAKSDLMVITKTKKLLTYILTITEKSPVKYRHSFVTRMHNLGMDVIECLYYANEAELGSQKRRDHQDTALVKLRLLDYVSEMAKDVKCITMSQYSNISKEIYGSIALLDGWIKSDKERKEN